MLLIEAAAAKGCLWHAEVEKAPGPAIAVAKTMNGRVEVVLTKCKTPIENSALLGARGGVSGF